MATPISSVHPMRFVLGGIGIPLLAAGLTACATVQDGALPVSLSTPENVGLQQGRVTVVVVDELGIIMPRMRVNMSWEEPSFYRTSSFTNWAGEVTFSGVPQVAEISIDHPGGIYTRTLLIPQRGRPELRVMVDTMGEGELMRERERARMQPQGAAPASR